MPLSPALPKDVVAKVMAERQAIIDGKHVYAGPLKDTSGKEVVAAGKSLDDGGLWKMDWYRPRRHRAEIARAIFAHDD